MLLQLAMEYTPAFAQALRAEGLADTKATLLGTRRVSGESLSDQFHILAGLPLQGSSWMQSQLVTSMLPLLVCVLAGAAGMLAVLGLTEALPVFRRPGTAFPSMSIHVMLHMAAIWHCKLTWLAYGDKA